MRPQPAVSVIIPTYNRPEPLRACLASLARQDFPIEKFEVVVVDDGSKPAMKLDTGIFDMGLNLQILVQDNKGPSSARNAGAQVAKGEFLLFTDDDCEPCPNWVRTMVATLHIHPETLVGGKTINALKSNVFAQASQLLNSYVYEYYNQQGTKPRFFASNNIGLAKHHFSQMGGFNTTFTSHYSEDRDFCDRWIQLGKSMVYEPGAVIEHSHVMGPYHFLRQHFRYGTGARSFHLERKQRNLDAPPIEPPRFYLHMFAFPFRREGFLRASVLAVLIVITQIAHTLGYLWQRFGIGSRVPRNHKMS